MCNVSLDERRELAADVGRETAGPQGQSSPYKKTFWNESSRSSNVLPYKLSHAKLQRRVNTYENPTRDKGEKYPRSGQLCPGKSLTKSEVAANETAVGLVVRDGKKKKRKKTNER